MKFKKVAAALLAAVMISSSAAGCGSKIDANAAAATLDGKEISMGVANFIAQYQAVQMDSYFLSYYGEDMWSSDSGEGTTMTESVKEDVMENLQVLYLLDAHASDYDVALTDEEKEAITQAAAKFLEDNTQEALDTMGATQETVEEMLRLNTIQSKMHAAITEQIDTKVTAKESAQKTFSYVRFEKKDESDTSADDEESENTGTDDADTDSEPVEAKDSKEEAEEFLDEALKDMDQAVQAGGYTVLSCSFGAGDLKEEDNTTTLDVAVLEAADKLKNKEVADSVIETDDAYFVIHMDDTNDKEAAKTKKESILSKRRTEKYDEVLESYKKDCEWKVNESEWKKVNFDELYTVKTPETDQTTNDTTADDQTGTDDSTADNQTGTDDGTAGDQTGADDSTADGETGADDSHTGSSTADDGTEGSTADDQTGDSAADDQTGDSAADDQTGADDNSDDSAADGETGADDGGADGESGTDDTSAED